MGSKIIGGHFVTVLIIDNIPIHLFGGWDQFEDIQKCSADFADILANRVVIRMKGSGEKDQAEQGV